MGEKYKSSFLSDKDTKSILEYISEIMVNHGWSFNIYAHGKYSYWKNGPIWEFGDSVEVVEAVIDKYNNINRLVEIIKNISRFYSPLILLDKVIANKTSTAIIYVVESSVDMQWKEVSIAFEYDDLFDISNELQNAKSSKEIKEIFVEFINSIQPYYAISALEIKGLVEDPEQLKICEEMLGDFNYFSCLCADFRRLDELGEKYEIIDLCKIGKFVFTQKDIGLTY